MLISFMKILEALIPSKSSWLHLRFGFSFFLLPIYLFALSQAPQVIFSNAVLTFLIWHVLVYPASNGYNSYFDKDESSIALVEKPPPVDKSLYYFSIFLDVIALVLSLFVSVDLLVAVLLYGVFSKLYSHPATRLKKYPIISFLIVFTFQGACIYWSSYASIAGLSLLSGWNLNFILAGLICSFLIGANYPLTQVYQHEEDGKRGDHTLSMALGIRGSFRFSALFFFIAAILMFTYWNNLEKLANFWLFIPFALPIMGVFINWVLKVWQDERQANFRNMSRLTLVSAVMMFVYFTILNFIQPVI
jgi:4-hydroxybenzoate polyprenyltransferase